MIGGSREFSTMNSQRMKNGQKGTNSAMSVGSRVSSTRNKNQTPRSSVGQTEKYVGEILQRNPTYDAASNHNNNNY